MALVALTPQQLEAFGEELDELRRRTNEDLGRRDREYIERVIAVQRGLEIAGRALLFAGHRRAARYGGIAALSLSKILDNMEIGHNVMHGQYDFLGEPALEGNRFDWDTVCPGDLWRHSHNFRHHYFTNISGKDRDIGYAIIRMDESRRWHPVNLGNPLYAALLALFFEWGVMLHDLEIERMIAGRVRKEETFAKLKKMGRKVARQGAKDYVLWPLLTGPNARRTATANATANIVRNLWTFTIIFCGHFPEDVTVFTRDEGCDESRGAWYLRQIQGSANIEGSRLFHVLTGNLSHQIEHHLFPEIPAHRYGEFAPEVRDICERYGIPYTTGGLGRQFASVISKIVRLSLPARGGDPSPVLPLRRDAAGDSAAA